MAKYCWKCGKELRDEAKFCKYCGTEMTSKSFQEREKAEPPKKEEPQKETQASKDKRLFKIMGIFLGVIVLAVTAGAIFYYSGTGQPDRSTEPEETTVATETTETPVDENIAEKLTVVLWDINFSQVEDLDTQPVEVLLKIKNASDVPVKSVDYEINYSGTVFENREDGGNLFNAYGYIKPGETGYLYGQIKVPSDTPTKQGYIIIKNVTKGKDLGDYKMPYGEIVNFNIEPDAYDIKITNPNDRTVIPNRSVVIAVIDDKNTLNDAWGCGIVEEDIAAGDTSVLKDVIYNPGFAYKWNEHHYSAFVIEKDVIGIK